MSLCAKRLTSRFGLVMPLFRGHPSGFRGAQEFSSFVNKLREATDVQPRQPVNWEHLHAQMARPDKAKNNMYIVRGMSKILEKRDLVCRDKLRSFLEVARTVITDESNVIEKLHLGAVLGAFFPEESAEEIMKIITECIAKEPKCVGFPVFGQNLTGLAISSPENCQFVSNFILSHPPRKFAAGTYKYVGDACLSYFLLPLAVQVFTGNSNFPDPDLIIKSKGDNDSMMALFKFLVQKRHLFNVEKKEEVISFLNRMGYKCYSSRDDNKKCSNCSTELSVLTEEEHNQLKTEVAERVVKRNGDVYQVSTPQEEKAFYNFLLRMEQQNIKFDLVVDGLNLMNARQAFTFDPNVKHRNPERTLGVRLVHGIREETTVRVMDQLCQKFKRILFFSRAHIKSDKAIINYLKSKSDQIHCFFIGNDTEDDIYILRAATQSHDTYLLTNDFLRREKAHLAKSATFLERWLQYRQIFVDQDLKIFYPSSCERKINISEDHNRIHVPFLVREHTVKWVCAEKYS